VAEHARAAERALSETSAGPELATVHTLLAWSHAHAGEMGRAREELGLARNLSREVTRYETIVEAADIIGAYSDIDEAHELLLSAASSKPNSAADEALYALTCAEDELRRGDVAAAADALARTPDGIVAGHPAFRARRMLASLRIDLESGMIAGEAVVRAVAERAQSQGAAAVVTGLQLVCGAIGGPDALSRSVKRVGDLDRAVLSVHAELLVARLDQLDESAARLVRTEAQSRPTRWRPALRRALSGRPANLVLQAAQLLELIGDASDVLVLRRLSKDLHGALRRPDLVGHSRVGSLRAFGSKTKDG